MSESSKRRVAWIVGASGDLGRATALWLAERGTRVVLSGRNLAELEELAEHIGSAAEPVIVPLDIRSNESVQRAFEQALQATGHVDWLVNSTSLSIFGDPLALEDDDWSAVLDTKLLGYVRTTRVVIRHLLETERAGAIVNISGRGGRQPKAVHLPGGAANAAVNLLTKGFADAYGARGIRVNAVAPGPIDSSRLAELDAVLAANPRVDTSGREPTGRPENIASAVAYLLSDEAAFINGTVLAVDGGSLKAV